MEVVLRQGASGGRRLCALCLRTEPFSRRGLAYSSAACSTNKEQPDPSASASASTSTSKTDPPGKANLGEFLSQAGPPDPSAKPLPFDQSTSAAAALADQQPLPFLSIPLGVRAPPKAMTGNAANKMRGEMDVTRFTEKRMQKRKLIVQEATRGYFHDFHAIRSHGGKTWRSPNTLIREDVGHKLHPADVYLTVYCSARCTFPTSSGRACRIGSRSRRRSCSRAKSRYCRF